ncbi:hypothetical protein V6N12_005642 [Hibiscus sabdariffa]|uniref:Uncharacterized protein n=1 Tax=Hibiscus sabdariffa TaxID=183260 RepID=A0ABR2BB72_9ROSI
MGCWCGVNGNDDMVREGGGGQRGARWIGWLWGEGLKVLDVLGSGCQGSVIELDWLDGGLVKGPVGAGSGGLRMVRWKAR